MMPGGYYLQSNENRKRHIDELYEKISLDNEDKRKSRAYVDEVLNQLISHVRIQENGNIYGHQIVKAGSYPVNAKIGKADEFDTNIFFNIEPKYVRLQGQVYYKFTELSWSQNASSASLQTPVRLDRTMSGETIPDGYAVVGAQMNDVPPSFRHLNVMCGPVVNAGSTPGCVDVIPRDVKQDLLKKIETARNYLGLNGLTISKGSHGPALTLTITPPWRGAYKISVDVTVSLKCPMIRFIGWPRQTTRRAFDNELIENAIDAGIHLVPKKDLFWAVSYSRAERALLSSIDKGLGCRKFVLKLLKMFLEKCQRKSASKLPGMSSHILKTQVLLSCEIHADDPGYWNRNNRDVCLINTMSELVASLGSQKLQDYFNTSINVLTGKYVSVVTEVATFMDTEMKTLAGIV